MCRACEWLREQHKCATSRLKQQCDGREEECPVCKAYKSSGSHWGTACSVASVRLLVEAVCKAAKSLVGSLWRRVRSVPPQDVGRMQAFILALTCIAVLWYAWEARNQAVATGEQAVATREQAVATRDLAGRAVPCIDEPIETAGKCDDVEGVPEGWLILTVTNDGSAPVRNLVARATWLRQGYDAPGTCPLQKVRWMSDYRAGLSETGDEDRRPEVWRCWRLKEDQTVFLCLPPPTNLGAANEVRLTWCDRLYSGSYCDFVVLQRGGIWVTSWDKAKPTIHSHAPRGPW